MLYLRSWLRNLFRWWKWKEFYNEKSDHAKDFYLPKGYWWANNDKIYLLASATKSKLHSVYPDFSFSTQIALGLSWCIDSGHKKQFFHSVLNWVKQLFCAVLSRWYILVIVSPRLKVYQIGSFHLVILRLPLKKN